MSPAYAWFEPFLMALDDYLTGREQGDLTTNDGELLADAFQKAVFNCPIPANDPKWADVLKKLLAAREGDRPSA